MPVTINPADVFMAIGRKFRGIFMSNVSDIESLAVVNPASIPVHILNAAFRPYSIAQPNA